MNDTSENSHDNIEDCTPVEQLAEEFLERLRSGEHPRICEYTYAHPNLAGEINDVFRTLAMLENFALDQDETPAIESLPFEVPPTLGDYRIIRELGRGGMGVVYEAEHEQMRRHVALKVLHSRSGSQHDVERFMREARSAGRLHHTNIVPVFEIGVDEDTHFYAMQCIHGQNLDLVISDLKQLQDHAGAQSIDSEDHANAAECLLSGQFNKTTILVEGSDRNEIDSSVVPRLPSPANVLDSSDLSIVGKSKESYFHRVARIGFQVADAIGYAHDHGILHRDIKPSNLILDTSGTVWITDFGLASCEGDDLTKTGDIVGTLRYMAPERFRGKADFRSDIYSLGLTLYELSTMQFAFDQVDRGELIKQVTQEDPLRPSKINTKIPRDLETIILKCIEREPAARYRSAHDVALDLQLFLADHPIQARRTTLVEQTWRWCRRNPAISAMVMCIACLLLALIVGVGMFAIRTKEYSDDLFVKQQSAERAGKSERLAHLESKKNLYESLFQQAQSERRNQLSGRSEKSLSAIHNAASLLGNLSLGKDDRERQEFRLRNEAAALLGQVNVSINENREYIFETRALEYDHQYEKYAISRGDIEVRQSGTNELIHTLPQQQFRATDFDFSIDGNYLAALHRRGPNDPKTVCIWDLKNHQLLLRKQLTVDDIVFSPNTLGTIPNAAIINGKTSMKIFRSCDTSQLVELEFDFEVTASVFSPDQKLLAVAGNSQHVEVWSIDSKRKVQTIDLSAKSKSIDWKNQCLAVGLQSGLIEVFDVDQGTKVAELKGHSDDAHTVSMSADCSLLISTSWDTTTRLWQIQSGKELKRFEGSMLASKFSDSTNRFSLWDINDDILVYDVDQQSAKRIYYDQRNLPRRNDVAIHPKSPRLAASATSAHTELWDLELGQIVQLLRTDRTFVVRFSQDGTQLATSGRKGLKIWNVNLPKGKDPLANIGSLNNHFFREDTYEMDTTPNLEQFIYVTVDGSAFLISPDSPERQTQLDADQKINQVAISPNGNWVTTTSLLGGELELWSAESGEQIEQETSLRGIREIAFSPNGKFFVAMSSELTTMFETGSWDILHQWEHSPRFPGAIVFSPDSRYIVRSRDRYSVEIVDSQTHEELIVLESEQQGVINSAAFSSSGDQLALSLQKHFEVWNLADLNQKLSTMGLSWSSSP